MITKETIHNGEFKFRVEKFLSFIFCVFLEQSFATRLEENSNAVIKKNILFPKKKSWGNCDKEEQSLYSTLVASLEAVTNVFLRISRNFSK